MKSWKNYIIDVSATGFSVLLLLSVILFWARCISGAVWKPQLINEVEHALFLSPIPKENESDTKSRDPVHIGLNTYILENLQPPVFGLASYFTASVYENSAEQNSLFILPNSFIAAFTREKDFGPIGGFLISLLIISPSIMLGAFFAWRVHKDATVTGFSKRVKRYWLFGTILFGLSAYITYRLARPKETLVTCPNCGKLRKPDMDRCHRCGSKWIVPELTPPTWRVVDGQSGVNQEHPH